MLGPYGGPTPRAERLVAISPRVTSREFCGTRPRRRLHRVHAEPRIVKITNDRIRVERIRPQRISICARYFFTFYKNRVFRKNSENCLYTRHAVQTALSGPSKKKRERKNGSIDYGCQRNFAARGRKYGVDRAVK